MSEQTPTPPILPILPITATAVVYDRELWRTLGNIESGVNQLLQRETRQDERMDKQDKSIRNVQNSVWLFVGGGAVISFIVLKWEFFKMLFSAR